MRNFMIYSPGFRIAKVKIKLDFITAGLAVTVILIDEATRSGSSPVVRAQASLIGVSARSPAQTPTFSDKMSLALTISKNILMPSKLVVAQTDLVSKVLKKQQSQYSVIYNFFNPNTPHETDPRQCTLYARFAPIEDYWIEEGVMRIEEIINYTIQILLLFAE
ncbi:jg4562 [Pararge aegeria aegeria]|uniref:Jg4562 protein n=1 Tax=Pararge aegeria aegeria TaxID=348720 RepID=A0A8S4RRW2_9NEOP|nr:jg4562 [Pararge aegeria aegeria]